MDTVENLSAWEKTGAVKPSVRRKTIDAPISRLVVKDGGRFLLVKTTDIDWISATGEYATLHSLGGVYLVRMAISALSDELDSHYFARIHRSTIVNLDRVREIQPHSHGDCEVILQDGTLLRLSRSYRSNLLLHVRSKNTR
jgi:two-component system LytT family response regulator